VTDIPFGPVNCTTVGTDPTPQGCYPFDTGQTGTTLLSVHLAVTTDTIGYQGSANTISVDWYNVSDVFISRSAGSALGWSQASPVLRDWTAPPLATRAKVLYSTALDPPGTLYGSTSATCHVSGTFHGLGAVTYCAYGQHKRSGEPQAILIGLGLITALAGALAAPWLFVFLVPAIGLTIDIEYLCVSPRPQVPDLKALSQWGPADALAFVQAAVWNQFCECIPASGGAPPPLVPPDLVVVPPAGHEPILEPVLCDETSMCSLLNSLSLQIGALQQQMAVLNPLVTLIQRQGVPFGYLRGQVHAGLTGEGEIAVADILGLEIASTTVPGWLGLIVGDPDEVITLGRISLGVTGAWQSRHDVLHQVESLLPISGAITRVGYTFAPGVTATITELVREP